MATIANLDINLNARTSKFDRNIKKSGGVFGRFSKGIKGVGYGAAMGGLAGVAAAAGGAALAMVRVNRQFREIDKLAKFADSVGINVTELQALRHQAEITGASVEGLDKGVARFVRVLGDAKAGDALAVDSFRELGLAAADFDGLTLTQQVGKVSDAINAGETAADRASKAYSIFGRSGQTLQNFFAGGAKGIEKAADDISRFGAEITRVDAARIEQMNDSWTRMNLVTTSLWQNLAIESAPVLQAVVESFTDAAAEAGGFGSVAETSMSILVSGIGFALDGWNIFMGAWKAGQAITTGVIASIVDGIALIEDAMVKIGGRSFDFGVRDLADSLKGETQRLAAEASVRFGEGFSGSISRDLEKRISDIKQQAVDTAAKVEEKNAPKPPEVVEPPSLKALFPIADRAAEMFSAFYRDIDISSFSGKPEKQDLGLAAVTRGSSAAQTILNNDNKERKVENAIKAAADERRQQLDDANGSLSEIAAGFSDGAVKLVSLAGF